MKTFGKTAGAAFLACASRYSGVTFFVVLGFLAVLASRRQVDGERPLEREPLNLALPAAQVLERGQVSPSSFGYILWDRGQRLTLGFSRLAAGDLVKLKLKGDGPKCRLVWELDTVPLGVLDLSQQFREFRLLLPRNANRFSLRFGGDPCPVHFSRVKRQAFVATTGEGFLRAYLVSYLKPRPRSALVRVAWPCGVAAVLGLFWTWLSKRRASRLSGVPMGLWATSAVSPLVAEALAMLRGAHPVVPWETYLQLWLGPQALPAVVGVAPYAGRGLAALGQLFSGFLQLVRDLRQWAVRFFTQPVPWAEGLVSPALGAFYAFWLFVTLPQTPMEWDELLFAFGVLRFDVVSHGPHPPGYPLYVWASKLVAALGVAPVHATQGASIAGALLVLWSMGKLLRDAGIGAFPRLVSLTVLALAPVFVFAANLGFSDMLGLGLACETLRRLWRLAEEPSSGRAAAAGFWGALALAARPPEALLLLFPALGVVAKSVRQKRWGFLWALPPAFLTSAVLWLSAILLTGWKRYWSATAQLLAWAAEFEKLSRFPAMPLSRFVHDWLQRPVGGGLLALAFWTLVVVGSAVLVKRGAGRLVGFFWAAAGPYLAFGPFLMTAEASVRYSLPAFALLAVLAGGVAFWPRSVLPSVLPLSWAVAAFLWVLPALTLRAAEPNPAWAALEFARDRLSPEQLTVATGLRPHAQFVFHKAGVQLRFSRVGAEPRQGQLAVVADSPCPGRVWFTWAWPREPMATLTRRRYLSACVVQLQPQP